MKVYSLRLTLEGDEYAGLSATILAAVDEARRRWKTT